MSIGAGLLWSTIIALIAIAIWRTTVNKKWKTVGKVVGGIALLGVIVGVAIWGWLKYQDRPQVVTQLAGIAIGMSKAEVTLALGKPTRDTIGFTDGKLGPMRLAYVDEYNKDKMTLIYFDYDDNAVERICELDGYESLLGFSKYSDEQDIIEKLGAPGDVSIHKEGLRKIISYPQWKAAYIIEKGDVRGVCTSKSGIVKYEDELGEAASPTQKPWEDDPVVDEPSEN